MQNEANYRVIDRKKFAVIMAVLLIIVAVGVWTGLSCLAEYRKELEELAVTEPLEAATILLQLIRTLAILNGIVLSSLALLIIRHGWRSWQSGFMPAKGSWIPEGQRTWSGEPAVRIAKFKIAVGAMLGVLGVASSLILWRLGDTVADQPSKRACILGHDVHAVACHDRGHDSIRAASITSDQVRLGSMAADFHEGP